MRFRGPLSTVVALTAVAVVPAAAGAAAPQIAAFERHNGTNFDIGLVNAATGASLVVPSSVNTTADEFHPALSPDGRYLVFTRATLVPQPDGDVVPPAAREVLMLDRQTGTIRSPINGRQDKGAGATIVPGATTSFLSYGIQVDPSVPAQFVHVAGPFSPTSTPPAFAFNGSFSTTNLDYLGTRNEANTIVDVPHAAVHLRDGKFLRATQLLRFDQGTGGTISSEDFLFSGRFSNGSFSDVKLLNLTGLARHATPRNPDGHVALDVTSTRGGTDVRTIQFPGDTAPSGAPSPINTADPERMPAWSADGVQLGFVRTSGLTPRRRLLVFDATPGVQTIQNPAVDLGSEAPSPQLREFQANFGGLALAATSGSDSLLVNCAISCSSTLADGGATGTGISLTPTLTRTAQVGILIARRTGTRRLFGRRVARIKAVGRVPLGKARSRRPRFRWDGRVNGKRLRAGTYLLTFRALGSKSRVLATSNSLQFKINRRGRITRVRRLRG